MKYLDNGKYFDLNTLSRDYKLITGREFHPQRVAIKNGEVFPFDCFSIFYDIYVLPLCMNSR